MSGVEAAASLFGSEDSASDPFTTLGTDNTSTNPFDDLFTGTSSGTSNSNIFNDSAFSTNETLHSQSSVESQRNPGNVHELYNPPQRHDAGQNGSTHLAQATELHTTTFNPPALSVGYPNANGSQEYAPRVPDTPQPSVAASAYVNNYTPQSYALTSTYTAYTPPAHPSYPAPTPTNPPATNYLPPSTSTNVAYLPSASASVLPKPTPSTSIPNRPKLTNAYDPPFLPTKPSRRTGRTAPDHHPYNVHQSSGPSVPYASETNVFTGTDDQRDNLLREEVRKTSPDIPKVSSYITGPPKAQEPTYKPGSNSTVYHASAYSSGKVTSVPHENYLEHATPSTILSNGDAEPYRPRSHTPRSSSIGSNSSLPKSDKARSPSSTSPSMVPFPYSPSGPPRQAASDNPSYEDPLAKTPPQCSPNVSPRLSRKALNDPYAPTNRSNYIPRTASPLQNQYLPSETGKVPAALKLNGMATTPHNGTQPFTLPEPETGFNTSVEGLSPRHAICVREPTRQFSLGQYAPSPSLVGANDPLSRTSSRAPVVTFGFGGKMITCFHGMPGLNAGFDVALSARTSSELKVRILQQVLPESVLNSPGSSYPGPLVSDPGMVSLSLVRSAVSSQAKAKKSGIITYLSTRAEEISQGLGFLSTPERTYAENKLILIKLLKVLVENDGRLLGSPQVEAAVRTALTPRLVVEPTLQDGVSLQAAAYQTAHLDETPISVTNLQTSSLSKIEELLLQGNRRQASQYAMDQKLWAHAMIIASSIDKDAWKEVINDFLHQELTLSDEQAKGSQPPSSKKSWESLRVTYSFFSGQGAAAIQEFAAPTLLSRAGVLQPLAPTLASVTPRTPNFASMQPVLNILPSTLSKWAETVAMMLSSPLTPSPEMNGALVALGDQLMANNWVEAAHACYLLSPYVFSSQPPLINGFGSPGTRILLLGSRNPGNVFKDPDSLIFSEILEFAMSLLPTSKGQESFHGLPHLQAYRFARAVWLAEMGEVQLASRYCEAITASLSPTSPYTNSALLEQLNGLQQRLSGVFHGEKSNSWIGGKITKPSLDSIGGWLEGRFTKLVTGDNECSTPSEDHPKTSDQQFIGPFAHYSTISSTVPSSRSSPQPTVSAFNQLTPPLTNSVLGNPYEPSIGSSSMQSKPNLPLSGTSTQNISPQWSPTTTNGNGDSSISADNLETPVVDTWWSGGANDTKTPTAATFLSVQHDMAQANSDGFISLMDSQSFAFDSKPPSRQATSPSVVDALDEEDLGLGNPKSVPEADIDEQKGNSAQENKNPAEQAAEKAPSAPAVSNGGGSWFGRFFRRSDNTSTGPVKANLGEDNSLYYDKELKRWVNKTGSTASASASVPAPPARAQTASPGMSASKAPPAPPAGLAPPRAASAGVDGPPRPASAEPPTKVPPSRIRSNLAPAIAETVSGLPISPSVTPPPARPRSQATKRNVRNRYVDVFQQENGSTGGAS